MSNNKLLAGLLIGFVLTEKPTVSKLPANANNSVSVYVGNVSTTQIFVNFNDTDTIIQQGTIYALKKCSINVRVSGLCAGTTQDMQIRVYKSIDNGLSWGTPILTTSISRGTINTLTYLDLPIIDANIGEIYSVALNATAGLGNSHTNVIVSYGVS